MKLQCRLYFEEFRRGRELSVHLNKHGEYAGLAVRIIRNRRGLKIYLLKELCEKLAIQHGDVMIIVHEVDDYIIMRKKM